ncbi:hypothetical protein M422DRAFT_241982 [Sphaerobolus stellatus SS14]|nr:hypothetical protein M422DRAFT_241982 [Sphaerobolus stellatus SS14]
MDEVPSRMLPPPPRFPLKAELIDGFTDYYLVRDLGIGFLALLYYDHLLTLGDEIELLWTAANTVANCKRLYPGLSVLGVIFSCFGDIIALLHVAVLWRRDRTAIIALLTCFVVTTVIAVTSISVSMVNIVETISYEPLVHVCRTTGKPLLLAAPWVAGIFFDLISLVLIYFNSLKQGIPFFRGTGVLSFLSVICLRLFNLLATTAAPVFLLGAIVSVAWPCFSINLSRFVFHLRNRRRYADKADAFRLSANNGSQPDVTEPRSSDDTT